MFPPPFSSHCGGALVPFWVFLAAVFGSALGSAIGVCAAIALVLWLDRPEKYNDSFADMKFWRQ